MPDHADPGNLPVPREGREVEVRGPAEELTVCPSCGRLTATVGRGTCAECWRAKTPGGEPAVRPTPPRTLPLLGPIDDVPDWIWSALVATVGGLIVGAVYLL